MAIPLSEGSVMVSDQKIPVDVEIISRTQELTFGVALLGDGRKFHFRIEKSRIYYQFLLPPKYIREIVVKKLKDIHIKAFDATLRKPRITKHFGINVE